MSITSREAGDPASAVKVRNVENEPIVRKIFIANINSYQGKAIAKKLPDIKHYAGSPTGRLYKIYGSLQTSDEIENEVVENYAPRILDPKNSTYMQSILDCEIIIYDIGMHASQVTEAQKVLDLLETKLKLREQDTNEPLKYFILISTALVWARTSAPNVEDPTEPLSELDYPKRRPHPCYLKHMYLEREVMNAQSRQKGNLRTIVICPGVTYGGRNDVFHHIFKKAFYNKESIEIYQPNQLEPNYIPMIYINDFAQMVLEVIENFPREKHRYLLAVQPELITLKTFGIIVAKSLAGNPMKVKIASRGEILASSETLISQRIYHYLSLNLRMAAIYFKEFSFSFTGENYDKMGDTLADEYRRERNLLPIKIIVDGPPCVGKTTLCEALAELYEINYVHPESAVYTFIKSLEEKISETKSYLRWLKNNNKRDSTIEGELDVDEVSEGELQAPKHSRRLSAEVNKISSSLEEHLIGWETELAGLNEYMQSMGEDGEMEIEYVKKCLVEILSSKPCSENQGYIMDSFPFDYTQTAEIFLTSVFQNKEDGEETHSPQPYTHNIMPNAFIILMAPDDILCKRAMCLNEKEALETKNTEEQLMSRLAKYRKRTEEDVACSNYFSDNEINIIVIKITADMTAEQILEIAKKQIGPPHKYPLTRAQLEEIAKNNLKAKAEAEEIERNYREQVVLEEAAAKERKLQEWTQKFEHLKRQEQEILEAKSMPLRSYLCKYVLPTLTEGLLKVAETKPDDPIEFLAEYLFKCNPTGHVLDPAYSEDAKRLLLCLDCDSEKTTPINDEEESRNENVDCDDSFIARHLDTKGSFISLSRKQPQAQKSDLLSSSSNTRRQTNGRPSKKVEKKTHKFK